MAAQGCRGSVVSRNSSAAQFCREGRGCRVCDSLNTAPKSCIAPAFLQSGDTVAIIAPSYYVDADAYRGVFDVLRQWGFVPVSSPNLGRKHLSSWPRARWRARSRQGMAPGYGRNQRGLHLGLHLLGRKTLLDPAYNRGRRRMTENGRDESQEGGTEGKCQASLRHRNGGQRRMTENGRGESQEGGTEGFETGERGSHRP